MLKSVKLEPRPIDIKYNCVKAILVIKVIVFRIILSCNTSSNYYTQMCNDKKEKRKLFDYIFREKAFLGHD